jgi:hypothetical protein
MSSFFFFDILCHYKCNYYWLCVEHFLLKFRLNFFVFYLVRQWLKDPENQKKIDRIIFCVDNEKDLAIYEKLLQLFFPLKLHPQIAQLPCYEKERFISHSHFQYEKIVSLYFLKFDWSCYGVWRSSDGQFFARLWKSHWTMWMISLYETWRSFLWICCRKFWSRVSFTRNSSKHMVQNQTRIWVDSKSYWNVSRNLKDEVFLKKLCLELWNSRVIFLKFVLTNRKLLPQWKKKQLISQVSLNWIFFLITHCVDFCDCHWSLTNSLFLCLCVILQWRLTKRERIFRTWINSFTDWKSGSKCFIDSRQSLSFSLSIFFFLNLFFVLTYISPFTPICFFFG